MTLYEELTWLSLIATGGLISDLVKFLIKYSLPKHIHWHKETSLIHDRGIVFVCRCGSRRIYDKE